MPLATGSNNVEGEKIDLQSCKDAFVVLKRLSYGQQMTRRGLLSKAKMITDTNGNRRDRQQRAKSGFTAELELMNEKVTLYEFANCIVDHNLEYEEDGQIRKLDFRIPEHVKMLDGNVGQEIDELITDLNNFEAGDDTGK